MTAACDPRLAALDTLAAATNHVELLAALREISAAYLEVEDAARATQCRVLAATVEAEFQAADVLERDLGDIVMYLGERYDAARVARVLEESPALWAAIIVRAKVDLDFGLF